VLEEPRGFAVPPEAAELARGALALARLELPVALFDAPSSVEHRHCRTRFR